MTILTPGQKAARTRKLNLAKKAKGPKRARVTRDVDRVSSIMTPRAELTAGQKAALTKAARIAAREKTEQIKVGVSEDSIVHDEKHPVIDVWLDNSDVGCGWRRYIVLEITPHHVTLFYVPLLLTVEIDRVEFEESSRPAKRVNRKALLGFIEANIKRAEKINDAKQSWVLSEGGTDVAKAIELLK